MVVHAEMKAQWGKSELAFSLSRADVKRLRIAVHPDGRIAVSAPLQASDEEIIARVSRRGAWIVRQQERFSQWRPRTPPRQYVSGETHLFQGRQLRLRVLVGEDLGVTISGDRLVIVVAPGSTRIQVKDLLQGWYAGQARTLLRERYREQSAAWQRHRLSPPRLMVRALTNRWGSLTSAGNLILNSDLVRASPRLIDYVIAHELAHVAHPDHGADWQRLLTRVMPDWRSRKAELEQQLL
jgi:predicted metal-dependent hydrolase